MEKIARKTYNTHAFERACTCTLAHAHAKTQTRSLMLSGINSFLITLVFFFFQYQKRKQSCLSHSRNLQYHGGSTKRRLIGYFRTRYDL